MALEFPVRATIGEAHVVIVSASDYDRLVRSAGPDVGATEPGLPAGVIIDRLLNREGRQSPYLYDRELMLFLVSKIGTRRDKDVHEACIAKFGKERSPSASALNRLAVSIRVLRREAARSLSLGSGE